MVAGGCRWLQVVAAGCRWLQMVAAGCVLQPAVHWAVRKRLPIPVYFTLFIDTPTCMLECMGCYLNTCRVGHIYGVLFKYM